MGLGHPQRALSVERGHRDSFVLVFCCVLVLTPSGGAHLLDSCSVMMSAFGQNSCNTAWMIDVTEANLAPFTDCQDKLEINGVREKGHGITSVPNPRPMLNKSVCAQIDLNIVGVTYLSVHVCTCLNCSLVTKTTTFENSNVWSASRMYKLGVPSLGPRHVYCLKRLLAMTRQTSCHIQNDPARQVILCHTESAHTENGCFRIWWQHRMCKGYLKCKTHSSNHTCHSLFEKQVNNLVSQNIYEAVISVRNLTVSKPGRTLTVGSVLSADVRKNLEDTTSRFFHCLNCSASHVQRHKRDTSCPLGLYGPACDQKCHCQNYGRCHINGSCLSGMCASGWRGVACSSRACPAGKYGFKKSGEINCKNRCNCPQADECNIIHGACSLAQCSSVLPAVRQKFDCFETVCPRRKLGLSTCSDTCHCSLDAICDSVSGYCPTPVCTGKYEPPTCSKITNSQPDYWRGMSILITELVLLVWKVCLFVYLRLLPEVIRLFRAAKNVLASH